MKYLYMSGNSVNQIHCDDDPQFPITKKFPESYLASCMQVEEDVEVQVGYIYENGVFLKPEPEDPTTPIIPNQPTQAEKIATLQAKLQATTETQAFQEECLIEMAAIVYA